MISHVRIALVIVLTALTLSACSGWQLRGQTSTPELESITLDGASAALLMALRADLREQGRAVEFVGARGQVGVVLGLYDDTDCRACGLPPPARIGTLDQGHQLRLQEVRLHEAIAAGDRQVEQRRIALGREVVHQHHLGAGEGCRQVADQPRADVTQRACDDDLHA